MLDLSADMVPGKNMLIMGEISNNEEKRSAAARLRSKSNLKTPDAGGGDNENNVRRDLKNS